METLDFASERILTQTAANDRIFAPGRAVMLRAERMIVTLRRMRDSTGAYLDAVTVDTVCAANLKSLANCKRAYWKGQEDCIDYDIANDDVE